MLGLVHSGRSAAFHFFSLQNNTNLNAGVTKINFLNGVRSFVTRSKGQPISDELSMNRVSRGRSPC